MSLIVLLLALGVVAVVAAVAAGLITDGLDDPTTSIPARRLPPGPITGDEVSRLRFVPALRGYRMDQVDAALDRLGEEIDRLRGELEARRPPPAWSAERAPPEPWPGQSHPGQPRSADAWDPEPGESRSTGSRSEPWSGEVGPLPGTPDGPTPPSGLRRPGSVPGEDPPRRPGRRQAPASDLPSRFPDREPAPAHEPPSEPG